MKPVQMVAFHRFRIELVLLGMALGNGKCRDQILKDVQMCDLQSELVHDCLDSIRSQDHEKLASTFRHWGVDVDMRDIAGSLIAYVQRRGDEERARNVLERALVMTSNKEELREALSSAQRELDSHEE